MPHFDVKNLPIVSRKIPYASFEKYHFLLQMPLNFKGTFYGMVSSTPLHTRVIQQTSKNSGAY